MQEAGLGGSGSQAEESNAHGLIKISHLQCHSLLHVTALPELKPEALKAKSTDRRLAGGVLELLRRRMHVVAMTRSTSVK